MNKLNNDIMVTIVCITYNHGDYIRDALEGFVNQKTNFNFEIIIHDDASTDDTTNIIKEYEKKYPNIIKPIFQTQNQHSLNKPILKSFIFPLIRGKYVAICEGDDYWIDNFKLQKQYDFLENNIEYSLVACSTKTFDCVTEKFDDRFITNIDKDISIEELILEKNGRIFQTASAFMKAKLYMDRKNWQSIFPYGDRPLWMRAALDGKIRMMKDVMTVYRFCATGSWTERLNNDMNMKRNTCNRAIAGFKAFDESTNCIYHNVVEIEIHKLEYSIAIINQDWANINSKYMDLLKKEKLTNKLKIVLRCKYSKLYNFLKSRG